MHTVIKQKIDQSLVRASLNYRNLLSEVEKVFEASAADKSYLLDYDLMKKIGQDHCRMICIGSNAWFPRTKIKNYVLVFNKARFEISGETIPYLKLLDALLIFARIKNDDWPLFILRYRYIIQELAWVEKRKLVKLCRKYPPGVRVILALILKSLSETNLYFEITKTVAPRVVDLYKEALNFLPAG